MDRNLPQADLPHFTSRRRTPSAARTLIAVATVALLWLTAMYFRWEIRAHWWAWQVRRAQTPAEQDYYTACLASIGNRALDAVAPLADDGRAEVREVALRVLRRCDDSRAGRLLVDMLADNDDGLVAMAAIELARRDRAGTVRLLIDRLPAAQPAGEQASPQARQAQRATLAALGRLGGPEAQTALLETLATADDPDLLAQAIDALGMLECREAVPLIAGRLNDRRPLTTRPASWNSAARAAAALRRDLASRGIRPDALLEAVGAPLTVAGVASRTLRLLGVPATREAASRDGPFTSVPADAADGLQP